MRIWYWFVVELLRYKKLMCSPQTWRNNYGLVGFNQRTLTVGGRLDVWLVSILARLDSTTSQHTQITCFLLWSNLVYINWRPVVHWAFHLRGECSLLLSIVPTVQLRGCKQTEHLFPFCLKRINLIFRANLLSNCRMITTAAAAAAARSHH